MSVVPFAFGVDGIKKIGLERWSESFSWPLSAVRADELKCAVWSPVYDLRQSADVEYADLVDICMPAAVASQLVCYYETYRLVSEDAGKKILTDEQHQYLDFCSGKNLTVTSRKLPELARRNWLRVMYDCFRHAGQANKALAATASEKRGVCIGKFNDIKRNWLMEHGYRVRAVTASSLVKGFDPDRIDSAVVHRATGYAEDLCVKMTESLSQKGFEFNESLSGYFSALLASEFVFFAGLRHFLLEKKSRQLKQDFFVDGLGNHFHRTVMKAVTRAGGCAYGSSHGNSTYLWICPYTHKIILSTSEKYLVQTPGAKKNIEKTLSGYLPDFKVNPEIESVGDDFYVRQKKALENEPKVEKIKTVMYLGAPFSPAYRIDYPDGATAQLFDIEYRILQELHKQYLVIYKAHPDRLKETDGGRLLSGVVDEILVEPFENVMKNADAYVFGHIASTTFHQALASNKPVIYFDRPGGFLHKEAQELLDKRAGRVNTWIDERNRICFDSAELSHMLESPADPCNTEYFDAYMAC